VGAGSLGGGGGSKYSGVAANEGGGPASLLKVP